MQDASVNVPENKRTVLSRYLTCDINIWITYRNNINIFCMLLYKVIKKFTDEG